MTNVSDFKIPIGLLIDLSETENEREVLDTFARWIPLIFDCKRAAVGLAAETGIRLFGVEDGRISQQGEILPFSDTVFAEIYSRRASLIERNLSEDSVFPDLRRMAARGMTGALMAPLVVADRCLGAAGAAFTDNRMFSDDDIFTMEAVARSAASYLLLHQQVAELNAQALTDSLTKCYNRRHYRSLAATAWNAWTTDQTPYSLAFLDLDRFKSINDTYGHGFGDEVLVATARSMRKVARDQDVAIRLGGEEFCLFMPDTDQDAAEPIANALRSAVEDLTFTDQGHTVRVTTSIGLATVHDALGSPGALAKAADDALYLAKKNGRNQVWLAS
ncbi:MAG: sensor domain-containing diguanylate cyclase [Silicimonas sp.]|nr:sensor domain-containing diguanylate cyclase [Silicimonas sp.]